MKIKHSLSFIVTTAALLLSSLSFAGADVEVNDNSVTLAGYDAVAYFTENAAVEGSSEYTSAYNNAIYYFKSASNRDVFNANPGEYAPQYGGFCAYGAALGKKFDVNGKAFEIVDGKLYVNKNEDVYETWEEDKSDNIDKADKFWNGIKAVPASDL